MAQHPTGAAPFLCPAIPPPLAATFHISLRHVSHALPDGMLLETPATISTWRATSSAATARARRCCCDCCSANCLRNPAASSVADARRRAAVLPAGGRHAGGCGWHDARAARPGAHRGTGSQADFDLMDGRWRVREEWPRMLADAGLPAWPPEQPASAVSGG